MLPAILQNRWSEGTRDAGLAVLFARFNRRYFRGRLLRYRIILLDRSGGLCWTEDHVIEIGRDDQEPEATLVHEMCHAAAGDGGDHGPAFLRQLKRCARLGAPGARDDLALCTAEFRASVLRSLKRAAHRNPWNRWPIILRGLADMCGMESGPFEAWARGAWYRLARTEKRTRQQA